MSATNRGAQRVHADYYPTPAWCVHRLLESLKLPSGRWLEPCAGTGNIIQAVNDKQQQVTWTAVELREECSTELESQVQALHEMDFLQFFPVDRYEVAITNPPYGQAEEFIWHCYDVSTHVLMLLRLNFLGSSKRVGLFGTLGVPDIYVLPNRPAFVGGRTDATEYAWFHWHPQQLGRTSILPLTPAASRTKKNNGGGTYASQQQQPSQRLK